MHAMQRRLLTILSASSLALCVVTCLLWRNSYQEHRGEFEFIGERRYSIASTEGMVFMEQCTATHWTLKDGFILGLPAPAARMADESTVRLSKSLKWQFHQAAGEQWFPDHEFCGFGWAADNSWTYTPAGHDSKYAIIRKRLFALPYWFLVAAMLVLPMLGSDVGRGLEGDFSRTNARVAATICVARPTVARNVGRKRQRPAMKLRRWESSRIHHPLNHRGELEEAGIAFIELDMTRFLPHAGAKLRTARAGRFADSRPKRPPGRPTGSQATPDSFGVRYIRHETGVRAH